MTLNDSPKSYSKIKKTPRKTNRQLEREESLGTKAYRLRTIEVEEQKKELKEFYEHRETD